MILTRHRMGRGRYLIYGMTGVVLFYLLLPIVFIPILSFDSSRWLEFPPPGWTLHWYGQLFGQGQWIDSIVNSVKVGILVTAGALVLGLPTAFVLVRGNFLGKTALNAFFTSPMIVPVVIIAVALYGFVLRAGLAGTLVAFVLSHLILALPFVVISISSALQTFDIALEKSAMICGATRLQALRRITLPSIRSGIIAGSLFAFLISWDEVVLAIFMATPSLQTLPVKIWITLRTDMSPVIAAASSVLIAMSVLLLGANALLKRVRK
jgi:putative spermidine/putrescine transport system permease protein